MKFVPFILAATMALPCYGETVFTVPQGYTKVTIGSPATNGQSQLTAISATLLKDVEFSGAVTIGAFTDNEDPLFDTQALSASGVTWTASQWTPSPYLAYIAVQDDANNADGIAPAEEAFLITANTTGGGLTLETSFDLTSRFPASTTVKIRKANTLNSFFGTSSASFAGSDIVYIWSGSKWDSFQFVAGAPGYWASTTDGFTDVGDITIIHPDEGLFVSRTVNSDITLTLFGEVPVAPQISTIVASSFVSSRFPINTTLGDSGIANAAWNASDLLYIWNSAASPAPKWDAFQFISGTPGYWASTTDGFTPVDNTVIPANSAVFVARSSPISAQNGGTTSALPYTIE